MRLTNLRRVVRGWNLAHRFNSKVVCDTAGHSLLIQSIVSACCQLLIISVSPSSDVGNNKCDDCNHAKGTQTKLEKLVALALILVLAVWCGAVSGAMLVVVGATLRTCSLWRPGTSSPILRCRWVSWCASRCFSCTATSRPVGRWWVHPSIIVTFLISFRIIGPGWLWLIMTWRIVSRPSSAHRLLTRGVHPLTCQGHGGRILDVILLFEIRVT